MNCGFKYTTLDSVKVRLANKVQFQADPRTIEDGELPNALLVQLIKRAETKVELALRSRYAVPFRSKRTNLFSDLPEHTKEALTTIIDDAAVMGVLKTDFGSGTHINAEGYFKNVKADYNEQMDFLLGHDAEAEKRDPKRYRFAPPLEDLLLSPSNKEADDGFKGMIINTDMSTNDSATYAANQINDPSRSYFRRRVRGL